VRDFGNNYKEVTMHAIWTGHPDDNNYSQATPTGSFVISLTNPALMDAFKPQKTYNFTIEEHVDDSAA
jgi:hypothetical protein